MPDINHLIRSDKSTMSVAHPTLFASIHMCVCTHVHVHVYSIHYVYVLGYMYMYILYIPVHKADSNRRFIKSLKHRTVLLIIPREQSDPTTTLRRRRIMPASAHAGQRLPFVTHSKKTSLHVCFSAVDPVFSGAASTTPQQSILSPIPPSYAKALAITPSDSAVLAHCLI